MLAQIIAVKSLLDIALILDPAQFLQLSIGLQLVPTHRQQGPDKPPATQWPLHRHTRQALGARTTQQLIEHGFHLIIAMMAEQQQATRLQQMFKNLVPRFAGGSLNTLANSSNLNGLAK